MFLTLPVGASFIRTYFYLHVLVNDRICTPEVTCFF